MVHMRECQSENMIQLSAVTAGLNRLSAHLGPSEVKGHKDTASARQESAVVKPPCGSVLALEAGDSAIAGSG